MMNKIRKPAEQGGAGVQLLAIAVIVLVGIGLAILILRADGQRSTAPADDDDGPPAVAVARQDTGGGLPSVLMEDAQLQAAGIAIDTAGAARIASVLQFPGEVLLNDDRTVHVVPRVPGIAESVLVSTGQAVKKGQVLAVFSSQLISEQRSALQTAQKRLELAVTVHEREKRLWEQKITAEQDYLQAQQVLREAEIAVENARQKLIALGVPVGAQGAQGTQGSLNRFELRAPYDGLVVERNLSVGEAVKEDTPIFTLSDLGTVWVEVHIPAKDLPQVRVGGKVGVRATAFDARGTGTVAFLGALVGEQTRMARARIVLPNPQGTWRPGLFVNVEVGASDVQVPVAVDTDAIQSLGTQSVVFVREEKRFIAQPVKLGASDGRRVEVLEGLPPGTRYAGRGSYIIKSELTKLKSEEGL